MKDFFLREVTMNFENACDFLKMSKEQVLSLVFKQIVPAEILFERNDLENYLKNSEANKYYSVKQAAIYLNVEIQSIYTCVHRKILKAEKKITKDGRVSRNAPLRFRKAELDLFLEKKRKKDIKNTGSWVSEWEHPWTVDTVD